MLLAEAGYSLTFAATQIALSMCLDYVAATSTSNTTARESNLASGTVIIDPPQKVQAHPPRLVLTSFSELASFRHVEFHSLFELRRSPCSFLFV